MSTWWRRILAIVTLGGGFTGVVITLAILFSAQERTLPLVGLCILVTLLYSYGCFLGLALAEGRILKKQLGIYYGIQIPIFNSPQFAYHFISGFHLSLAYSGGQFGATFRLGSEWVLSVNQMQPWAGGINLFATAVVVSLFRRRSTKTLEKSERSLSNPSSEY